jgi:hypothetical protein
MSTKATADSKSVMAVENSQEVTREEFLAPIGKLLGLTLIGGGGGPGHR